MRTSALFATATCGWLVVLLAAPLAARATWPAARRGAVLAYMAGRVVCHQRADRSFHLLAVQLPVCARCTGLYGGAALGALAAYGAARRRRGPASPARSREQLAAAALPTLVTLGAESAGLAVSGAVRAAAALPLGAALAWIVHHALADARARSSCGRRDSRRARPERTEFVEETRHRDEPPSLPSRSPQAGRPDSPRGAHGVLQ